MPLCVTAGCKNEQVELAATFWNNIVIAALLGVFLVPAPCKKSCEHGQRCQVSDKIDPGHPATLWLQRGGTNLGPAASGPRPVTCAS